MPSRFLIGASALTLILAACSGGGPENSSDSASTHTQIETGGSAGKSSAKGSTHAGAGGRAGTKPDQKATGGNPEPAGNDAGIENAGMGGAGGDAGEPPPPCDLDGHCSTDGDGVQVTCGIEAWFQCEYSGFVGATAQVGWGQRAVIGLACCGACECVPVEVYYDGAQCWQGITQCDGTLHKPHAPTTPNPSFSVPTDVYGTFYLGSGGFGGREDAPVEAGGSGDRGGGGATAQGEAGARITPEGGG
jgi:hypothetical protein